MPLERDLSGTDSRNQVLDLDQDTAGNIWAACSNLGVARIDPAARVSWFFGGTREQRADTVRVDRQGQVWVGTRGGLFVLRPDQQTFTPVTELAAIRLRRIALGSGGTALTSGGTALSSGGTALNSASDGTALNSGGTALTSGGTIYLATTDAGLYVGKNAGKSISWQQYQSSEGGLAHSLFAVTEDRRGNVWVGSEAGLLGLTDEALRRPREPALANIRRPVYFLLEDPRGRLWIGTDYGVYVWDGKSLRHLTVKEGLAGNSTYRSAAQVDRHGAVWIGTDRGLSRFQEAQDRQQSHPLRVDQLQLDVGNQRLSFDPQRPDLVHQLEYTSSQLLFSARAITFVDENRVQYQSWLEGLDAGWVTSQSSTHFESRYPIVPPGKYRFQIRARYGEESEWGEPATLGIVIAQPFWQQGWFFLLLLSLTGVVAYSGYHYWAQTRYSRRLEAEVQVRTAALVASEGAIAAERERLSVTLGSIVDGVIATDREGRVVLLNHAAQQLTGWSEAEAQGHFLAEILKLQPEGGDSGDTLRAVEPVARVLAAAQPIDFGHYSLTSRQGQTCPLELTGAPVQNSSGASSGVVFAFRDIGERRRIEEERARNQQLEALGVLAGGIAHDFNNILTGVIGNLSLAKLRGPHEDQSLHYLSKAEKALDRAGALARQLLTFARGGAPVTGPASIVELVREAVPFVLSGSNIRCEFDLPDDLWAVEVDQGQINQVLSNLLINALQAMPEGGVIWIRGRNVKQPDAKSTLALGPLAPGNYVQLVIEDRGVGIAPRHLRRVFEPYFTTKQNGSGLGLATAYSIMKKHGGTIWVDSQLGVGTTFGLLLPASVHPLEATTEKIERIHLAKPNQAKRILLMDDEDAVLQVLSEMLDRLGHETVCAADGQQAIELYRDAMQQHQRFDLVVLDLTVPGGIGGREALQQLHALDPEVVAVVSTGYSRDPVMSLYREYGLRGVLPKPYRLSDVVLMLEEVFASPTFTVDSH